MLSGEIITGKHNSGRPSSSERATLVAMPFLNRGEPRLVDATASPAAVEMREAGQANCGGEGCTATKLSGLALGTSAVNRCAEGKELNPAAICGMAALAEAGRADHERLVASFDQNPGAK